MAVTEHNKKAVRHAEEAGARLTNAKALMEGAEVDLEDRAFFELNVARIETELAIGQRLAALGEMLRDHTNVVRHLT